MKVGSGRLTSRSVLWFLASILVILLLGFVALPPLLKHFLAKGLSDALAREAVVERVQFNPLTLELQIQGLRVANRDGGELAGFDELKVNLSAASIFQRALVVDALHLNGPRLQVSQYADGRFDISDLLEKWTKNDDQPSSGVPRFSLNNLQLTGGQLLFIDQGRDKRHQIEDLQIGLPFVSSLPYQVDIHVQPMVAAKVNGSQWQLDGQATPFAEGRQSELNLNLADFDLASFQAYLPENTPLSLLSGRLDSALKLVFRELPEGERSLLIEGQAEIRDWRLVDKAARDQDLLAWKSLLIDIEQADPLNRKLALRRVSLDGSVTNLAVNRGGELNLLNLAGRLQQSAGKAAAGKPRVEEGASTQAFVWSLGTFEWQDGLLRWQDLSGARPVRGEVRGLQLRTGPVDARMAEPLNLLEASAQLDFGPDLQVDRVNLQGLRVDLAAQRIDLDSLQTRQARISMKRAADGQLQWLSPPILRQPAAPVAEKPTPSRPWLAQVARLEVDDLAMNFRDETVSPAAQHQVSGFKLNAERVGNVPNTPGRLQLEAALNQRGQLKVAGDLQLVPLVTALKVETRAVPLRATQAYLNPLLKIEIQQGLLSNQGMVRAKLVGNEVQAAYQGSLTLGQFLAVDPENRSDFLKWKSLHLNGMDLRLAPLNIDVREIALSDFYSRLILSEDGKLNVANLMRQPAETDGPAKDAPTTETPENLAAVRQATESQAAESQAEPAPPLPVRIGKVTLNNGTVDFSDYFVKPNYSVQLGKLGGQLSGLSSVEGTQAEMELRGTYGAAAPVLITARLNPLAAQSYLDLQGEVQGIDLTGFSPYSGKYAGHVIDKGALSLKVAYKLENRQLSADNHLFIDQLTLGERVESPDATSLPVNLAIALLRNNRGEIDLNLPLSGSLDDPQFSIGGLIVKVVVNLFVKAVTSPFALLGSMFGGGEELSSLEFAPGQSDVGEGADKTLLTLAKALNERDGLKLEIAGAFDPETDREGLKQRALREALQKEKRLEVLKKDKAEKEEGDIALSSLQITPQEYPVLLARVYKAAKFPKPRNTIGLTKTLPPEEMEKLLLANYAVDEEALRRLARQRAEAVQRWLIEQGELPAGRLFLVSLKDGADKQNPGRRVEFALR